MKKIAALAVTVLVALSGLGLVLFATSASATTPTPFPKGTSVYYTYDKGYGMVVATSGINVSLTGSFTINAAPYYGVTWTPIPNGGNAFSNYINQVGEFVYGPAKAGKHAPFVPVGYPNTKAPAGTNGLKLVWKGKNAYTNNVETYVYEGTGLHKGEAFDAKRLLTTGSIFP